MPIAAQQPAQSKFSSTDSSLVSPNGTPLQDASGCSPFELATAAVLTLKQRACFFAMRLIAPSGMAHAAFSSGFSQWRNVPLESHEDMDDIGHRFAAFYARRAAQNAGEMLGGLLNREDPRPRVSSEHGFWNRTRSALWSVVRVENANGSDRLALGPIAGAFGSGFTGMACFRSHDRIADGFRMTALSYGGYFGTALAHEFHPDILSFANHLRHRKKPDLISP